MRHHADDPATGDGHADASTPPEPPPDSPGTAVGQLDPRIVAGLHTRVAALEMWRAHQSDLLDELLNTAHTDPATAHEQYLLLDDGPDEDNDGDGHGHGHGVDSIDTDVLIAWVHHTVTAVIARPLRGEHKWCPRWWEHPEAIFRFTALHHAWTELAPEPGCALSVWIRDHLDPCLRELLHPAGPFADCTHNERYRTLTDHTPLPTLPTTVPEHP